MSFGHFKRTNTPNYPVEARRAAMRSRDRQKTMKSRRPSALRSVAHRAMLDAGHERERDLLLYRQEKKQQKIQTFVDHKIFPGLVDRTVLSTDVVGIQTRAPNMARSLSLSLNRSRSSTSLMLAKAATAAAATTHMMSKMPKPKVRLSRNELLESSLPGIDYLLRFKRAAFQKSHCPLPMEAYVPSKNRYDTGKASKPYSTSASADVESLRTLEQKHGRGWVSDPYLDSNPNGVATYGCGRQSSLNFRNHQPVADGEDFIIRTSQSAQDLTARKQWITLSSPGIY